MENLNKLFNESGLTLTEVSKLSGVSLSTLHRYIKGTVKEIKMEFYEPIYKALTGHHADEIDNVPSVGSNIKDSLRKMIASSNFPSEKETVEFSIDADEVKASIENNALKDKNYSNSYNSNGNAFPKRGEIWYVKNNVATGGEQWGSRPAVIISNNKLNETMPTVEVMFLTGSPKLELPTHCTISTDRDLSVVLGEQISSVSKTRLGNFLSKVTDAELSVIEKVALISLGIKYNSVDVKHSTDYIILQKENSMLREFIEKLTNIALK